MYVHKHTNYVQVGTCMHAYISHTHIHINMHKNTQTEETLVIAFLPGICVCEPNKYS